MGTMANLAKNPPTAAPFAASSVTVPRAPPTHAKEERGDDQQVTTLALVKNKSLAFKTKTATLVKQPHFQTVSICAGSGAITVGAAGGAFGCASGVIVGGLAGSVPALFTFGLSIPAGAVVGGVIGFQVGSAAGAATGAVAGGAAGHGGWIWRAEIQNGVLHVRVVAVNRTEMVRLKLASAKQSTQKKALELHATAKKNAVNLTSVAKRKGHEVIELRKDQRTQVTVASAAAGGVAGGTAGGGAGAVAGAGAGAVVGLPAALFTFGLSIPVCATIGGALGLAGGAAAGGAAGAAGGGAAGYGAHTYRKEIRERATGAWTRARVGTGKVRKNIEESVTQAHMSVKALVGGGTGGTDQ